ncbi:MAG: GNAT family N-acetyltransferase [Burkholderiales bacterium PBB4]|nr:MAG: GNAT family N-acetyltransferase [Burkholderiales bacterium PBB4]
MKGAPISPARGEEYAVREDYVIRVETSAAAVDPVAWDTLLAHQAEPSPFMRHAYLAALEDSGSACARTGWQAHFVLLEVRNGTDCAPHRVLQAGCVVYSKSHSYGEYVFDWAWANAYAQHGLAYYPKAVVAVPFTPVPSSRLLAVNDSSRVALVQALLEWCRQTTQSSLHILFADPQDIAACAAAGLMLRHTLQFHWENVAPTLPAAHGSPPPEGERIALGRPGGDAAGFTDFDAFLATLSQEKRKKIRQERRKVREAGVTFRCLEGAQISQDDWDFFYRCYERTYLEHGNAPYLTRDFFQRMADTMPDAWVLFIAEREGQAIASSLIAAPALSTGSMADKGLSSPWEGGVAYGRYWGALERVDCLHFEACYYQPLQWCIAQGVRRFEGGAQGEHKMARALLPVMTHSAHWLAHPAFADAVARFLEREGEGVENYLEELHSRSPFRKA